MFTSSVCPEDVLHASTVTTRTMRRAKWIEDAKALLPKIHDALKRNDVVAYVRYQQQYDYLLDKILRSKKTAKE